MKLPTFHATEADRAILRKISNRAAELCVDFGIPYPTVDLEMDLLAAREDIVTLDLTRLLNSSTIDFSHDIFGIRRFLNRTTGEVEHAFVPRCAR